MAAQLTALIHMVIAAIYAYTFIWDFKNIDPKRLLVPDAWWSRFVWLTMIDLAIQQIYHVVAAVVAYKKLPRTAFDFISTAIIFPLATTVVILFWGLWLADPTLVADPAGQRFLLLNPLYNHAIHTLPLFAMIVDHVLWRHVRPTRNGAFAAILLFAGCYITWVVTFNELFGKWAYPILAQLNLPARATFFGGTVTFIIVCFLLGDAFNSLLVKPKESAKKARNSAAVKKALGKRR